MPREERTMGEGAGVGGVIVENYLKSNEKTIQLLCVM